MKHLHFIKICIFAGLMFSSACTRSPAAAVSQELSPQDVFFSKISKHCGKAYQGHVLVDEPKQPNSSFADKTLVMHIRECEEKTLKIPFHVGEDRSRTWVLTRTSDGLRLKHDHRHEDGSHDAVTMYGGETATDGTSIRQEFPVDAESIEMFERESLQASITNKWALEIEPKNKFVYELSRPGGRLFRVEFDLTTSVDPPPAPWGHPQAD